MAASIFATVPANKEQISRSLAAQFSSEAVRSLLD
jgi:hypothetical protein